MTKMLYCLLVAGLLLAPQGVAHADDGIGHDRVIIGQNVTLRNGEVIDGDLVVIGGEVTIETDASVRGDLVVIGGSLRLDGAAQGSAIVIGGGTSIGETGSVARDLVALGGSLQRADGASIGGDIISNLAISTTRLPQVNPAPAPPPPAKTDFRFDFGPLGRLATVFVQGVGLAALAMLLSAFLHPQLDHVAQALQSRTLEAGSLGLLTVFLAPLAIVIMAITLILIPLALAAVFMLVLAWLFGIVALGQVVGERLTRAMRQSWEPVLSVGFGAFVLGIALAVLNQIPCVGWMAASLAGLIGLGAAIMTLFGTLPSPRWLVAQRVATSTPLTEDPPDASAQQ